MGGWSRPWSCGATSARVIRQFRPDLVIGPSPDRNWSAIYASHPDHLAAGEAAVAAVYPDSRNPFAHPELLEEGLEPHTVAALWMMAAPAANVAVDITDAFGRKVAALACHKSQGGDNPGIEERLSQWARGSAGRGGAPRWAPRRDVLVGGDRLISRPAGATRSAGSRRGGSTPPPSGCRSAP